MRRQYGIRKGSQEALHDGCHGDGVKSGQVDERVVASCMIQRIDNLGNLVHATRLAQDAFGRHVYVAEEVSKERWSSVGGLKRTHLHERGYAVVEEGGDAQSSGGVQAVV